MWEREGIILLVVGVVFVLSLVGSIVLFKLLKSTAIIKRAGYQAGGALAGFLLIYGALYYSFDRMMGTSKAWEPESWTIEGTVKREGETNHEGIVVRILPPTPSTLTARSGFFRLDDVKVIRSEGWPDLYFETPNYFGQPLEIDETTAEIIDSKKKQKKVKLKDAELPKE